MTGTLGLFSLVDLFQLLASSSRTGRLGVDHPAGSARVYFDKGRVVHAEFGSFEGEAAVHALFADERGAFEFTVGLPAPRTTVTGGTENLMLEAIRRVDEAKREAASDVAATAVPVFADDAPNAGSLTLQAQEIVVLRFVDGHRTVGQIAAEAGLEPAIARRVVRRLVEIGALRLRGRRARTARLVARLAPRRLGPGRVGIDPGILSSWEKVTGHAPERVACRRADGRVLVFEVEGSDGAGPFLHLSRDTLFRSDLAVDEALLVRPVPPREPA